MGMIKRALYVLDVTFAFLLACGQASAHHGSSNYDLSKSVSVKGAVTQFDFINPHSAIHLQAKNDKGNAEQWLVEADSPNNLARTGWSRDSLKPGDLVTIVGNRLKDGSKVMRLQKVIFFDGRELKPREGDEY
jgi:DNA/RNA endonuclease YhcR with UshA esterase domain